MMFAFWFRMFLIGVEYSIIVPSVWLYLDMFKSHSTVLAGAIIGMYPLSAMFTLLIAGRLYDKTKKVRQIILVLNLFQIAGSIMYAVPSSIYMLLLSRFLSGIGDGFFSCSCGEISSVYKARNRTGMLALMELGRIIGMILGPTLNFPIEKTNTVWSFGATKWKINNATLPGLIMAIMWVVMEFITFAYVVNLGEEITEETRKQAAINEERRKAKESLTNERKYRYAEPSRGETMNMLCRVEIFVLVFNGSLIFLIQTVFEVLAPLIIEQEFQWGQGVVGAVYIFGGVEVILLFIGIIYIGSRYSTPDVYMLLVSLMLSLLVLILTCAETAPKSMMARHGLFFAMAVCVYSSMPLNLVACKAMLSKVAGVEIQGTVHGLFNGVIRVVLVIGPVLGGVAYKDRKMYAAVMLGCLLVGTIAYCTLMKKLRIKCEDIMALMKEDSD